MSKSWLSYWVLCNWIEKSSIWSYGGLWRSQKFFHYTFEQATWSILVYLQQKGKENVKRIVDSFEEIGGQKETEQLDELKKRKLNI